MPAISEILDSVSVPSLIKDSLIKSGAFEKTSRGLRYYSGGFTVVFPVFANNEMWAFRCWHSELGNVRKRFKIISDYLNSLKSPYFCDFFYCDEGIVVDGKIYPTTRMKWVEGETINKYVENHIDEPEKLKSLASSFITMIEYLHEHKIAHGDLQHGNIIVNNGELKLVDYDSVFVPGLEGSTDIIIGKADYQHPNRKDAHITSDKIDYFSELIIYLSILALAEKPELLNQFSIEDSMLFHGSDWSDFTGSQIYKNLSSIDNGDIQLLLGILVDYLKEDDITKLRPFTQVWNDLVKEPIIQSLKCGNNGVVYNGVDASVSWEIENFSSVYLNGEEIEPGINCVKQKFLSDSVIELQLRNGLHRVSRFLNVQIVNSPTISFASNKLKLRKENGEVETANLSWSVTDAHSVIVKQGSRVLSTRHAESHHIINPQVDTIYTISVIGLDKHTEFSKSISILVRDVSCITLESDKNFSLPGVPITISWSVTNAKWAKLNDNSIPLKGKTAFSPETDTEFILSVEDDFGIKTECVKVRMLPLPVVRSILVDTPNINKSVNVQLNLPHFESIPTIPIVETRFESLTVPYVPDLKTNGLFVELPNPTKDTLITRVSEFINRIFGKKP